MYLTSTDENHDRLYGTILWHPSVYCVFSVWLYVVELTEWRQIASNVLNTSLQVYKESNKLGLIEQWSKVKSLMSKMKTHSFYQSPH